MISHPDNDNLFSYMVEYVEHHQLGDSDFYYLCWAEDAEHAIEQCKDENNALPITITAAYPEYPDDVE